MLVFLAILALYALALNSSWRFHRDSCLYMGLARSLAETGSYTFNGYPHSFVWPGFPMLLASVYATVGESFFAMNLLLSLCGLAAITVWYLICPYLPVTRKQAYVCFALFAFSRTLFYYSSHIIADVPFTAVALLGLWFGIHMLRGGPRAWVWALAASAAVCVACFLRPVGPCLLVALIGALWLRPEVLSQWRRSLLYSALLAGPLVLAAGLWMLRCLLETGVPGTYYLTLFVTRAGTRRVIAHWIRSCRVAVASLPDTILGQDAGLLTGLVLLVPISVGVVVAWRRRERLLTLYGLVYLAAICLADPGRRYLLPGLPVLIFWLVLGSSILLRSAADRFGFIPEKRAAAIAVVLVAVVLATNLTRIGKVIYQARSHDFYAATDGEAMHDLFNVATWLRENAGPRDLVLAEEDRFLHYFSRVQTIGGLSTYWLHRGSTYGEAIKRWPVTLVVLAPGDPASYAIGRLRKTCRGAFEVAATFGEIRVIRVHRDNLTDGDD
jgi:hypothetical protein